MQRRTTFLIFLILLSAVVAQTAVVWQSKQKMVWLNGQRFNIKGVSWFGFETYDYVVHGLWAVDYKFIIDFLAANNFNAVRLPFSLDMVLNNPNTNTISYWCNNNHNCNSDLNGVKALGVLDKIISYMGTKGIAVLLDMHSFGPGQASSNGYWYDGTHSEATVIQGWNTLATRYKNYWNVFGMDIKNEPFSCTWGSGNLNTDFNLAAQRIGNAITANSNWLVFVEGITCQSGCFKGENLQGVQHNPVVLNVPNRVVYSPHAYGPDVFPMTYFYDAAFPNNMAPIWNSHFGYIKNLTNTDSALVVGEWGGTTTNSLDLTWLNTFSNYLKTNGLTDNFFWAVNPNSGQTGGILQNDWITPQTTKLNIIASVVPNPTNLLSVLNSTVNYTATNTTSNTTTGNNTNSTNSNSNSSTNTTNTNTTNNNNTNSNNSCNIVYTSQQGVLKINGQRFNLKGASWFGFQTSVYTVHGLWSVDYKSLVDFLASNQFNAVRLPFSLDMVLNSPIPSAISFGYCTSNVNCNKDLQGLTSLQVMDKIINYMGTKGILVMLDMHSFAPDAFSSNGLWYDATHSEAMVIQGWRNLVARYKNVWNVFAIDVKNEPFQATWGTGAPTTDFNMAAQRIGNAVVNETNWLVFVEGTANSPNCLQACFYGQNLQGVQTSPVVLSVPNRVVYSPHTYGPNVYNQPYFSDGTFPNNMPAIWDAHFGFIKGLGGAAVVTGQWGGSTWGQNGVWLNAYVAYLKSKDMTDNFFWCLNPNSGDTGGLLGNDWATPDLAKLNLLASLVSNPTNVLSLTNACTGGGNNTTAATNSTNTNTTSNCTINCNNSTTNSTNTTNANSTNSNSTANKTNTTGCQGPFTSQNGVLKVNGQRFNLKGASWFGFETGINTVHGLWSVDYRFLIDFLASNEFNAVRLPFSLDMVMGNPNPSSISYGYCTNNVNCNKDLQGLTSLQVMDKIIDYMGTKGILVMLDMHSFAPDAFASNGLWYDSSHSEAMVIQGWGNLVARYKNVWNVFAIDIKNEPFQATWGTGANATDFNLAAQRIGNVVVNETNWLVFVEGTANSPICVKNCFYGENLQGVQTNPVVLSVPNRVVYSPHTYGPNVYNQPYFSDSNFPSNMPAIWDAHFGFIKGLGGSAVVTGQWGGATSGQNGVWLNAFVSYLKSKDMTDNFFWCLNPDSGDTGGLLADDWITPDITKLNLLAGLVPNPSDVLTLMSTNTCSGANSTNGAGGSGNGTIGNNSTNTTGCLAGQKPDGAGACVNCSVFACSNCQSNVQLCTECLPSLYIDSYGTFCQLCLLAPSFEQCSQSSCSNYVFYNNQCTSLCSNIPNTNPAQSTPINDACLCNFGFVWVTNINMTQCLHCSSPYVTQAQCLSSQCPSFFWSTFGAVQFCNNCAAMGATQNTSTRCICPAGTFWDANTSYCYSCINVPINLCGIPTSCSNHYVDSLGSCVPCGANTVNRTASAPQTSCACAAGFAWSNGTCTSCATTQGQFFINNTCYNCPTVNALMNGSVPQSNATGCKCSGNYLFLFVGSTYQCTCNNTAGLFDLGNSLGCGACSKITGAIAFIPASRSCSCTSLLTWSPTFQKCKCANTNMYLKYNTVCASCLQTPTNSGVNPNTINSCSCINGTVWHAGYSQCVCIGSGTTQNQYYDGSKCVVCDGSTLGLMNGYNKCLCPPNSLWTTLTYSCVCDSLSIPINNVCTKCSTIPFALGPTTTKLACNCGSGWTWNPTSNICVCATSSCSCATMPNTAFSTTNKICQPCTTFDQFATPNWVPNTTQCGCYGAFQWQTLTNTCVCPAFTPQNQIISTGPTVCYKCDHNINALNYGAIFTETTKKCICFPNYYSIAGSALCYFPIANKTNFNVSFLNGGNTTCSAALTPTTSTTPYDNYNCICIANTTIFNDLTATCITCPLGKNTAVSCKCAAGQDWNILMMACTSTTPPGGSYTNPSYTKCMQSKGLASRTLIAYSPTDANQVYVSGTFEFAASAGQSTLYSKFAGYKCNCSAGYGWNHVRKRCYPTSFNYTY